VVTAAASAALGFTAVAASGVVDFAVAGFTAAHFAAVGFATVGCTPMDFTAADFTAPGFAAIDFTEIGFTMATSTTGSSSLTTLEIRSFTIPIHTTDIIPTITIPTAIIRMATILTAMATVVFAAAGFATFTGMAFMAVAFTAMALTAAALTAMAPAAIDDSYNEHVHQYRAAYTKAASAADLTALARSFIAFALLATGTFASAASWNDDSHYVSLGPRSGYYIVRPGSRLSRQLGVEAAPTIDTADPFQHAYGADALAFHFDHAGVLSAPPAYIVQAEPNEFYTSRIGSLIRGRTTSRNVEAIFGKPQSIERRFDRVVTYYAIQVYNPFEDPGGRR
jgi:hypothetical protein